MRWGKRAEEKGTMEDKKRRMDEEKEADEGKRVEWKYREERDVDSERKLEGGKRGRWRKTQECPCKSIQYSIHVSLHLELRFCPGQYL
jgi:hypothetical protein